MNTIFNYEMIKEWIPFLSKGLGITLLIALVSAVFGTIIGIILVIMGNHKTTNRMAKFYIDIFRGTPLLLQLSFIYFAIQPLFGGLILLLFDVYVDLTLGGLAAAFITFSMNSGAYISEIIRSGINSVDEGEVEAAKSLGVSNFHIYKDIILPISFRNSFPSLMNEFITLIKESSIVSIIGIQDLMRRSQIVTNQTYMYFEPLIVVGIIYYIVIKIFTIVARNLEVKLQYDYS